MNMSHLSNESLAIKRSIVSMCHRAKASHVGSGLSCADILSVLFLGKVLRFDPKKPEWDGRDRFIMSKGHASAAFYATLAHAGFFPISELDSYYQDGSRMPGHPVKGLLPGVEVSTGSLGHGLGLGVGMATAFMLDKKPNRVFVLMSDGEMDEGSVWEAIMFAGAKKLENLVAIIDYNKIQSFGRVKEVLDLEPLEDKFRSFGWQTRRVDGNSVDDILNLFNSDFLSSKNPKVVIADTIKGHGVSFMQDKLEWHYKSPSDSEYNIAMEELKEGNR